MSDVGERIRKRRKEIGVSADTLADVLGVSRSTMFRYENGDIDKMPITTLEPIAKALRTTPAYLMGWEDEDKTSEKTMAFTPDMFSEEEWAELSRFADYLISKRSGL